MSGASELRRIRLRGRSFLVADRDNWLWDRAEAGAWEPATLDAIEAHTDPETVVFDIGSWIGPVALFAASGARRVICIEPDPVAAAFLKSNLLANPQLRSKVDVIERAIAPESGTIRLGVTRRPGDAMTTEFRPGSPISWEVETVTPADLARMEPEAPKAFLKIDIEGSEYRLLPAIDPLLAYPEVAVLASFHPELLEEQASISPAEIVDLTRRAVQPFAGFESFAIEGSEIKPLPFRTVLDDPILLKKQKTWLFVKARRPRASRGQCTG